MLSKNDILELNEDMLNLGAPDERDYMGYNQPDYLKMRGLAYLPDFAVTDLMAYAMLDSLSHYKNTQLIERKDEIEEAFKYYEDAARDLIHLYREDGTMFKTAYIDYCIKNKIHDFMTYVDMDLNSLTIHINGFVKELNEFKNDHKDKIKAIPEINREGKTIWHTKIQWDFLDEYLAFAKDAGRGYIPDEKLQDIIDTNKVKMIAEKERLLSESLKLEKGMEYPDSNNVELKLPYTQGDTRIANIRGHLFDLVKDNKKVFNISKGYDELLTFTVQKQNLEYVVKDLYQNFKIKIDPELRDYIKDYLAFIKSDCGLNIPPEDKLPFKPFPFQIEDAKQIISLPRTIIGHDMGLGKTFIATLVGQSIDGKKLAIVPEPLRLNWVRELTRVYPEIDVKCCTNKDYAIGKDWTIMGYKTAVKYENQLLQEGFNCIFIDEAHKIKAVNNWGKPASKQAEAVMNLCKDIKYVYPMTGTPIPTHNKDLFNLLTLVRSPIVQNGFNKYAYTYCAAFKNGYGLDANGNSNSEDLHAHLSEKMVRRVKAEVLPDLQKQRTFIPVDCMNKKIQKVESELGCVSDRHTFMGLCMSGRNLLSEAKVKSVIDFADNILADGRSVVIVANFNNTLDALKEHYKDNICLIRGGMSDKKKQKAIDEFQAGDKKICAMNIIAGGVGVTLTKAHDMIMVDYDWTPSNMKQAEDRIVRTGQTENLCNIYYMYCQGSALDEYFTGMLSEKSANIDTAIDNDENSLNLMKGLMEMYGVSKNIDAKQLDTEIKTFIDDEQKKELDIDETEPVIDSMDEINDGLEEIEL